MNQLAPRGHAHRWLWGGAAVLMAATALLGLVHRDMHWGPGDFLAWALMLLAATGAMLLANRLLTTRRQRLLAGAAVAALFLLVWAELAVGILGPG